MELVLLPLLLLAGLLTTLDSGSDNDEDGGGTDNPGVGDDTVAGSGDDRIFGFAGNDLLTLSDSAEGLGGAGDDTLTASDEAVGYGLEGDDSLTGSDNATVRGGDGDDWLSASDEAVAEGGAGNDVMFAALDAEANGGAGDDTVTAQDVARGYGNEGNDILYGNDGAAVFGGAGRDSILLDDLSLGDGGAGNDWLTVLGQSSVLGGEGEDLFIAQSDPDTTNAAPHLDIIDFNASDDELAVLLGQADTSDLTMTISSSDGQGATLVEITDANAARIASFTLQGVTDFDPASVRFFNAGILDDVPFTGSVVTQDAVLTGQGSEEVIGGAGDDLITLNERSTGYGGAGDDIITMNGDQEDQQASLSVTLGGQAYGGDGDDTILQRTPGTSADSDRVTPIADVLADGGAGNDLIIVSNAVAVDGGAGDDTVFMEFGTGALEIGSATLGEGSDRLAVNLTYNTDMVVNDFNPAEDQLAIIMPEGALDEPVGTDPAVALADRVSYTWDAQRGATVVSIPGYLQLVVTGVQTGAGPNAFGPGSILLYQNEAAFLAGTSYGTA